MGSVPDYLTRDLQALLGQEIADHGVFMGRMGVGKVPVARSVRRAYGELIDAGAG